MKLLLFALALLVAPMAAGCRADAPTAFEYDAPPYVPVSIDVEAVRDSLVTATTIVRDGWERRNRRYICAVFTFGANTGHQIRVSGPNGGQDLVLQILSPDWSVADSLSCYEGETATGVTAIGTCTTQAGWEMLLARVFDSYNRFGWTHIEYAVIGGHHQWNIRMDDGWSVFWATPTPEAVDFPCAEPPYWGDDNEVPEINRKRLPSRVDR